MLQHLDEFFHPVPSQVIYCNGKYQKEFEELPWMWNWKDFLIIWTIWFAVNNSLVVLDDIMLQCSNNDQCIADWFTKEITKTRLRYLFTTYIQRTIHDNKTSTLWTPSHAACVKKWPLVQGDDIRCAYCRTIYSFENKCFLCLKEMDSTNLMYTTCCNSEVHLKCGIFLH